MRIKTDCVFREKKWLELESRKAFEKRARALLGRALEVLEVKTKAKIELTVIFTNDADMKQINGQFRQANAPTNVLSFPLYEREFFDLWGEEHIPLGDVIFSLGVIAEEAEGLKITVQKHWERLLAHGILHLLGFDHNSDEEAENMEKLEEKILGQK